MTPKNLYGPVRRSRFRSRCRGVRSQGVGRTGGCTRTRRTTWTRTAIQWVTTWRADSMITASKCASVCMRATTSATSLGPMAAIVSSNTVSPFLSETCPKHFQEGEIYWQDEKKSTQLPNRQEGTLPDGFYNLTATLIRFCCIDNEDPLIPIELPTDDAFYLFPARKECQRVRNMDVRCIWTR